ncbi:DUF4271 domain-containing protein [Reichenbachiella sp. MALMAid0571]|uniref:DUF4271 domain-containing protein n=1 Tax=Reichenbachiella sp. MALMAid0571 TaxID=3143939 RepID=UPI0032DF009D
MSKTIHRIALIILILSLNINRSFSQNEEVEDLRSSWLVTTEAGKSFLPYVEGLNKPTAIHFFLDLNRYRDYYLDMKMPKGVSVLVEDRITFVSTRECTRKYSIDSLMGVYSKDKIQISLYGEDVNFAEVDASIIDMNSPISWSSNQGGYTIDLREKLNNNDFFIISILIILTIVLFVRRGLKNVFFEYFSFQKSFSFKPKSEGLFSIGVFSTTNLLVLLLYGVASGFTIVTIVLMLSDKLSEQYGIDTTSNLILLGIGVSVALIVLMIFKYFLVRIVSEIYRLRKFHLVQYYDYFRITLFLTVIFFGLSVVNLSMGGFYLEDYRTTFLIIVVLMLLMRPVLILFKLNKLSGYKNLHLFSYICGTEIIPLIIVLKFFLH